jgi:SAM-dependent methyltransferase
MSAAWLSQLYFKTSFNSNSPGSLQSARVIVPLLMELFRPGSVIDIGCGGGSWLQAFQENGVLDLLGVDGPWIDRKVFRLQPELLRHHDLTKPLDVGRRFDLANCLEVAEHLPAEAAPVMVENLVRLAPVVVFSAAIPAQYGIHHVNCQWPEYWTALFERHGYSPISLLRWQIWENAEVAWWYRQNLTIFASQSYLKDHSELLDLDARYRDVPGHVIHPECFAFHADPAVMPLQLVLKALPQEVLSRLRRVFERSKNGL